MRLNKFLAHCGIASRRKCDELIFSGRVKVNNQIITSPAFKVKPEIDTVYVDNEKINLQKKIYIALNKPEGYLCSLKDEFGRKIITDLIPEIKLRIYPVGRLDFNSEGLILLTNDGELSNRLIHPRYKVEKTYYVTVKGHLNEDKIKALENGIILDNKKTLPAKCKVLNLSKNTTSIEIKIREGKKRQIRRMLKEIGYEVKKLKRVKFGPIKLGTLKKGEWRYLTEEEIDSLYKIVGLK